MRADGIALVRFRRALRRRGAVGRRCAADIGEFTRLHRGQPRPSSSAQQKSSRIWSGRVPEERPRRSRSTTRGSVSGSRTACSTSSTLTAGERTLLIDVDNWYTIPDPEAEDRIASQRWHRDPWDNHIVKVFTYFSEVGPGRGAVRVPARYARRAAANAHLWPWEGDDVVRRARGLYPPQDEFEAKAPAEDVLTVHARAVPGRWSSPTPSGFHRGGWTRSEAAHPLLLLVRRRPQFRLAAALRGRLVGRQRALARGRVRRFLVALGRRRERVCFALSRCSSSRDPLRQHGVLVATASRSRSSSRAARAG